MDILELSYDYFFNPRNELLFGAELLCAIKEFDNGRHQLSEEAMPFFMEWFLFDFRIFGRETPLEHFYALNPYNISPEKLRSCKRIIEENRYDFFEVVSQSRKGIVVRGVREGGEFTIADRGLVCGLGDLMVTRLIPYGDRWLIASATALGLHSMGKCDHRDFVSMFPILDPRIVYFEIAADRVSEKVRGSVMEASSGMNVVTIGDNHLDDGCAVCEVIRKAKEENRPLTEEELLRAFEKASRSHPKTDT